MREILFRGKWIDNGEWIEGYLVRPNPTVCSIHHVNDCAICFQASAEEGLVFSQVDPVTVGQYTGLKDRNGVRIFEGDIIFVPRLNKAYEVKYQLGQFYIGINQPIAYERNNCEVVGNIHDNPELLEV